MSPYIGMPVVVYRSGTTMAGLITHVHGYQMVNVVVFPDYGTMSGISSVYYLASSQLRAGFHSPDFCCAPAESQR